MTQRFHLIWPLMALSLALAVLSGFAAVGLVREQRAAARFLRGDVEQYRAMTELEECFVELIALVKDRVRQVSAIHERADSLLIEVDQRLLEPADRERLRRIDTAFQQHLGVWNDLPNEDPLIDEATVTRIVDELERELLKPSHDLEVICSQRLQRSADEHGQLLRRTTWGLIWVGGLGGIAGLVFGFGVSQGVSRSIRRLQVQVRDAAGKLDPSVSEIVLTGDGNVVSLYDEMDSLTARIERFVATLQQRDREVLRAEQLAALGQLAAGVAHEIRNPLTSIKLLVQAELESASPGGMIGEDLRVIIGEVQRMERSLQSFLDYARPPNPERCEVDLKVVARNVLGLIRVRAERQGVQTTVDAPSEEISVSVDTTQIQQVVLNLVLNALDALPTGGALAIRLRHQKQQVMITIADTGTGIAPSMRDRLFQPFATNKETGLGLGLVTTRRIVEAHGGRVEVVSPAGGGTEFHVTLPTHNVQEPRRETPQ